jgi:hypothetical protein
VSQSKDLSHYPVLTCQQQRGFRLINSKFPPTSLFDDVADEDEFEAIFAIQALTNPRVLTELGDLSLLKPSEIPFGIRGCNYATAPFTHINPDGSRFSDGSFGLLYLAEAMETAIEETVYHQQKYFRNVQGLHYDSIMMRGLQFIFSNQVVDIQSAEEGIYHPDDYSASRVLGHSARVQGAEGLEYTSVRHDGGICWALTTPKGVHEAIQTAHYEYIWDGEQITTVNLLTRVR